MDCHRYSRFLDDEFSWLWWSPDFPSRATTRLKLLVLMEMSTTIGCLYQISTLNSTHVKNQHVGVDIVSVLECWDQIVLAASQTSMAVRSLSCLLANRGSAFCFVFVCLLLIITSFHDGSGIEANAKKDTDSLWGSSDRQRWRSVAKQRKMNGGSEREERHGKGSKEAEAARETARQGKDCCFVGEHRWGGGISCVFLWESGHLVRHPQAPASAAIN